MENLIPSLQKALKVYCSKIYTVLKTLICTCANKTAVNGVLINWHRLSTSCSRTTDTQRLNLIFCAVQIQIPLRKIHLGVGYKGLVSCRNIMENMDKKLRVPIWLLIVRPKIPPNASKNFSPKCLPKPKSSRFLKKIYGSCFLSAMYLLLHL